MRNKMCAKCRVRKGCVRKCNAAYYYEKGWAEAIEAAEKWVEDNASRYIFPEEKTDGAPFTKKILESKMAFEMKSELKIDKKNYKENEEEE